MSQYIIDHTNLLNNLLIVNVMLVALVVVVAIAYSFIVAYYLKKKREYAKKKDESYKEMSSLIQMPEYDFKVDENDKKLKSEMVKQKEEEINTLSDKTEKYERKSSNTKYYTKMIAEGCFLLWIFTFMLVIVVSDLVSPSTSYIREVSNSQSEGISVNAYYVTTYHQSDQSTISIYVKNNSNKILKSAKITEKDSNSSEYICYLNPGEEKIVSLEVYNNNYNKDFNFNIDEVTFED